MRYGISKVSLGFPGFIEINEAEYKLIKNARENLFEALFLEEKFDFVTENYYEYETDLLSLASRAMIFNDFDYFSMSRERNLVSRRIANLLNAGHMYLDQCLHNIKNMYGAKSDNYNLIKEEDEFQCNQILGYRVMKTIRNHQHIGFPIHGMQFPREWDGNDDNSHLLYQVIPYINVSALEGDYRFEKSILKELKTIQNNDQIDVIPLIRGYVEGIGNIQEKVRELIRLDLTNWEKILDDTITKFQNEFGTDTSLAGLVIIIIKDNGHREENKAIFKEFIKRRQALEMKNCIFVNLHKRYVSNKIRK